MSNRSMILRVLFLLVVLLGLAQLFNWGGDPGLGNPVTWLHILTGLAAIGLIEATWAGVSGPGVTNLKMIGRVLFVLVILLALAQLYDVFGPSGLSSPITWLHILAGLGFIAVFERLWAARTA